MGRHLVQYPNVVPFDCDVTNPLEVLRDIKYLKPDIVVHLASKSDVDWCEKKENEKQVIDVNFTGVIHVAQATEDYGCGMVLLSSDHIFNGKFNWNGYKESSPPSPINFYGTSKVAAEGIREVFPHMKIIRTSYLFDEERMKWKIDGLRREYKEGHPTFISRSFMYIPHFVQSLLYYVNKFVEMPNVLHISGSKITSWYDFMVAMAKQYDLDTTLVSARRMDLKTQASRPRNGGLNVSLSNKLGFPQYDFREGLAQMFWDGK